MVEPTYSSQGYLVGYCGGDDTAVHLHGLETASLASGLPRAPTRGLDAVGVYAHADDDAALAALLEAHKSHLKKALPPAVRESGFLAARALDGKLLALFRVRSLDAIELEPTSLTTAEERRAGFWRLFVGIRARVTIDEPRILESPRLHFLVVDAPHLGVVAPASAGDLLCSSLQGGVDDKNAGDDGGAAEAECAVSSKSRNKGGAGNRGKGKIKAARSKHANAAGAVEAAAEAAAADAADAAPHAASREIFEAEVLLEASGPGGPAAVLKREPPAGAASLRVELDAVVLVRREAPLARALEELQSELIAQSSALRDMVADASEQRRLCACVVQPELLPVPICVHYALPPGEDAGESSAASRRHELHAVLGLPMDQPLLRTTNALGSGVGGCGIPGVLRNPHVGLAPSGVRGGGVPSLVQGSYEYYHYLQWTGAGQREGKYDDDGWGCAYRSLMSIISWYRLQGYTSFPNPTHLEIQKRLVDHCGQPRDELLGKKQWLGSQDLALFLDHALGVSCITIPCSSGDEVVAQGRTLSHHFATQGTPVMIGGGELAFTLLGVDFSASSGDVRFLIMDPHYIGPDEVASIQPRWIGWKSADSLTHLGTKLFARDKIYNLLLPQRLRCI